MKTLGILFLLLLIYMVWQYLELKKFKVTNYKIKRQPPAEPDDGKLSLRIALVADFHSHEYGRQNERLMAEIRRQKPDLILVPGDMIVSAHVTDYPKSLRFFEQLVQVAPVYFSNGNHESRFEQSDSAYDEAYADYRRQVEQLGVHFLNNQTMPFGETRIDLCGVDIPLECYQKGQVTPLPPRFMKQALGQKNPERFTILLAHNPAYCEDYAAWGADLIVAGHTHGGLIRIPGVGSLISPQFEWFPKYDAGLFELGKSTAIISKGLGTHTFHIRIFDRAELVMLQLETEL